MKTRANESRIDPLQQSNELRRVLKLIARNNWDAKIRVRSPTQHGTVWCESGLVVDAELGSLWGNEALRHMVELRDARVRVRSHGTAPQLTPVKPPAPAEPRRRSFGPRGPERHLHRDNAELLAARLLTTGPALLVGAALGFSFGLRRTPPPFPAAQTSAVVSPSPPPLRLLPRRRPNPGGEANRPALPPRSARPPTPSSIKKLTEPLVDIAPCPVPSKAVSPAIPVAQPGKKAPTLRRSLIPLSADLLPWPSDSEDFGHSAAGTKVGSTKPRKFRLTL